MATIRKNVIVGDHVGKKQLLGQISFSTAVEWLETRAISIPDEAQRSLAKGANKPTTMELLDDDKVHTQPRMKEIIKFYRHIIKLTEQGMNGEGFLGTIQLVIPSDFTNAKVYLKNDSQDQDGETTFGVLSLSTARKEAAFFVGDGQGRLVGLYSLERSVEDDIQEIEKEIKKVSKAGKDTSELMKDKNKAIAFKKSVQDFLSANKLAFICYVESIEKETGKVTGLDQSAQRRLYIEGNALNSAASKEEVMRYESFSPVILKLMELRVEIPFMRDDYIEEDSKSIGLNSSKVFTLSTLTRAYSMSIINIENPIKLSTDPVFDDVDIHKEFAKKYWEKINSLFGDRWTFPSLEQAERTKKLQEHREKKTVYFSAIFLDSLGQIGFEAGKRTGWQPDADLSFLDILAREDYDPTTAQHWRDLMMKKSSKADGEGGIGYVFNNTKDSTTKVVKYLRTRLFGDTHVALTQGSNPS